MRGKRPWLIGCGGLFLVLIAAGGFLVMHAAAPYLAWGTAMAHAGQVASTQCPDALELQQQVGSAKGSLPDPAAQERIAAAYAPCIARARGVERADLEMLAATALAPELTEHTTAGDRAARRMMHLLTEARRDAGGETGLISMISLLETSVTLRTKSER